MPKKHVSIALAALLLFTAISVQRASAASESDKRNRLIEKVKIGVAKLGVGPDARVSLKLRDKTKLAGYISEITPDSFVVTDLKTGVATPVAYGDVTQVKGHNLSTGAKIVLGIMIGIGATLLFIGILAHIYSD